MWSSAVGSTLARKQSAPVGVAAPPGLSLEEQVPVSNKISAPSLPRQRRGRLYDHLHDGVDESPLVDGTLSHDEVCTLLAEREGHVEPQRPHLAGDRTRRGVNDRKRRTPPPAIATAGPLYLAVRRFWSRSKRWMPWWVEVEAPSVACTFARGLLETGRDGIRLQPRHRWQLRRKGQSKADAIVDLLRGEEGVLSMLDGVALGEASEQTRRHLNRLIEQRLPRESRRRTIAQPPPRSRRPNAGPSASLRRVIAIEKAMHAARAEPLPPALAEVVRVLKEMREEGVDLTRHGWKGEAAARLGITPSAFSNRWNRLQQLSGAA